VALLCNQGDLPGSNPVWQTLNRMNTEIIHVVTEQPYKIPPQPKPTQEKNYMKLFAARGLMQQFLGSKRMGNEIHGVDLLILLHVS
jgi:hypothetical protein